MAGATVFHYVKTEEQFRTVRQLWDDLNCTDYRASQENFRIGDYIDFL